MRRHSPYGPGESVLFAAFAIVAAVLGALMVHRYEARHEAAPSVAPRAERSVTLLYSASDGAALVRETRPLAECESESECIWETVTELIKGPLGIDLLPVLPAQTVLRNVVIQGDTAILDFNNEFRDGLPAGSSAEMSAVYSVVNTIAENFPRIAEVRFMLNGEPIETLHGHLDLRDPIAPDPTLVRSAPGEGK